MFWELKFYKNKKTAKIFADVFYQNIFDILNKLSLEENFNNPILIPIPLFFTNKIKRSYNQNSLILKYFKKLNKTNPDIIEIKYILKKIKYTKEQNKLKTKIERENNIQNIFKIKKPEKIKNRNIILFDDIYTTGATLKEATKELKKYDIKKNILYHNSTLKINFILM